MSLAKELQFLYESGMTEDELLAQAIKDSMITAEVDNEQTSARHVIEKTEEDFIIHEKDATRKIRAQQDIEYQESLREDREKDSMKFGKMMEESITSVDKEDAYDFGWVEENTIKEEKHNSREQLREARLKFFNK